MAKQYGNIKNKNNEVAIAASNIYIGGGSLNNLINYTTDEIRIGTWIDGKPLYRKIVTGKATEQRQNILYLSDINANFVYDISVMAKDAQGRFLSDYYISDGDYINVYVSGGAFILRSGASFPVPPYDYYITIVYTKTTD